MTYDQMMDKIIDKIMNHSFNFYMLTKDGSSDTLLTREFTYVSHILYSLAKHGAVRTYNRFCGGEER